MYFLNYSELDRMRHKVNFKVLYSCFELSFLSPWLNVAPKLKSLTFYLTKSEKR